MDAAQRVRTTRALLLSVVLAGLCLAVFGAFIGMGVPGLVISVAGWAAVVVGVVWLVVKLTRQVTARSGQWRPGDGDATK